ncbi:MAG: DUF6491 family protein [Gammaproteobacteria bacterium]
MRTSILLIAASALALVSCASTGEMARLTGEKATFHYADYAGMPVEGFQAYRINGWTPVSRTQLVVWTGVNDAYLIKVWNTCQDLQFADHVGVTSTVNRVTTFEKVRVGRDTCPISEIRPVDIKRMRADRKAAAEAAKAG